MELVYRPRPAGKTDMQKSLMQAWINAHLLERRSVKVIHYHKNHAVIITHLLDPVSGLAIIEQEVIR